MSETNWAALDAALCERLGIAPESYDECCLEDPKGNRTTLREDFADEFEPQLSAGYRIIRTGPIYPALSTTGDGMLVLIEALRKAGKFISSIEDVSQDESEYWSVRFDRQPNRMEERATLPQAVALAAAKSIGIGPLNPIGDYQLPDTPKVWPL